MFPTIPNQAAHPEPLPTLEPGRERRSSTRYRAADPSSWVGWFDRSRFVAVPSRLEDLSFGGARLSVDLAGEPDGPAPGATIYVGIGRPTADDWIEARVMGRTVPAQGPDLLRVMFPDGCPYDQFRGAIWGKVADTHVH